MGEKFNLSWHTFSSHGQELFRNLLETQEFSDVTLISDDQRQYRVHKFILSACSTVFKNILSSNPLNSFIYLRSIHHEELESILQFIYFGEATLYHERINEFLNVAKDLDITEIGKNIADEEVEKANDTQMFEHKEEVESYNYQNNDLNISRTPTSQNVVSNTGYLLIHGDTKPYRCQQCDYQAAHLEGVKYHLKSKHDGIKYPCQQCDYQATSSSNLQNHIQCKHEGIKYHCQHCNYKTTLPSNLQRHTKIQHTYKKQS